MSRLPTFDSLLMPQRDPLQALLHRIATPQEPAQGPEPTLPPEEQDSLLGSVMEKGVSGLGYIGKVLDKTFGGRAVRGLLGGKPKELLSVLPFSDSLGLTDEADTVHGTDLLADAGLVTRGDDSWQNLLAGVGAEIALDPSTYLTLGGGALTKAGTIARKFGKLPRGLAGKVGGFDQAESALKPLLQQGQRVEDIARPGATILPEAVEQAGRAAGVNIAPGTPLSGLVSVGLPFMDPIATFGTGPTGLKVAKALDSVGEGVMYSAPVRAVRAALDPTTEGAYSRAGQELALTLRDRRRLYQREGADAVTKLMQDVAPHIKGMDESAAADALRLAAEYDPAKAMGGPVPKDLLSEAYARLNAAGYPQAQADALVNAGLDAGKINRDALGVERARGVNTGELDDPRIGYAMRSLNELPGPNANYLDPLKRIAGFGGTHASQFKRKEVFEGLPLGTTSFNDLARDPALKAMNDLTRTNEIGRRVFGGPLPGTPEYKQAEQLSNLIGGLDPRYAAENRHFFSPDALSDTLTRTNRKARVLSSSDAVLEGIGRFAADTAAAGHAPQPGDVPVDQLLKSIGLTATDNVGVSEAAKLAAARLGLGNVNDLSRFSVPADLARDMATFAKAWAEPASLSPVVAAWDWASNLFKAWVTAPFPAFHARNLMSGLFNAWRDHSLDPGAFGQAFKVMRGGVLDAPLPGMAATNARDATQELIREAVVGRVAFTRDAGHAAQTTPTAGQGLIRTLPQPGTGKGVGGDLLDFAKGFVPEKGKVLEGLNPLNIEGVNRAADSNTLIKQARKVQGSVDDFAQLGHYISLRKQGFTPDAAAMSVKRYHNDYSELSNMERSVLRRVMPWYCMPIDHEILTRQGWKLHDQLAVGEDVMAYDHETGKLHWTPLLAVNEFDYDGDLMVLGCRGAKFRFTENHRWPALKISGRVGGRDVYDRRVMLEGKDLNTTTIIPLTGEFGGDESILTPRQAAILGWVVTDGSCRHRKGHCEMVVYQSEKKHYETVRRLLGVEPRKATDDRQPHRVFTFGVPIADVKAITQHYRKKGDLPAIVALLSREAAEAMYEAMMQAEGSTAAQADQTHFAQSRKNQAVIDAFQVLCVLTGRAAFQSGSGCYLRKTSMIWPKHWLQPREHYKGKIWCPTTVLGTWVVRHKGAVAITGNSYSRRALPPLLEDLATQPGRVAGATRFLTGTREPFAFTPGYVAEGASFRIPGAPEGQQRYISSFGLPMEDESIKALGSFAKGDLTRGLQTVLGMTLPQVKAPLEYAFDTQLFSGRRLPDLKPYSSVEKTLPGSEQDARLVSQAIANTPASRFVSTLDRLLDPRKGTLSTLANLASGVRVTDVDVEKERDIAARKFLEHELRGQPGVRLAEDIYVPREKLPLMDPLDYQLYRVYQSAGKRLQQRAKEKKEQGVR